jgi:hypothetical protein
MVSSEIAETDANPAGALHPGIAAPLLARSVYPSAFSSARFPISGASANSSRSCWIFCSGLAGADEVVVSVCVVIAGFFLVPLRLSTIGLGV